MIKNFRKAILGSVVTMTIGLTGVTSSFAGGAILAHVMGKDHMWHTVSEAFTKNLKKVSGNTMGIEYHPGGDLGDYTTITEQVMQGAVPMTMTWVDSSVDARLDAINLPFLADNWKDAESIYSNGGAMDKLMRNIYKDLNVIVLGTIPTDFTGYVVRKGLKAPVNGLSDAKGFKMRVPNWPGAIVRYKATGFSPVPMAFSEVHTALQTKAIDGRAYSPPSEVIMFGDVLESFVFTKEHMEITYWLASKDWFDGLSKKQQKWVRESADKATANAWAQAKSESATWIKKIKDAGIEVISLTPAQRKAYKARIIKAEYPLIEKEIGKKAMNKIKSQAGL